MKARERLVTAGLVMLLLFSWLGFVWHRSPRFAGSLAGGVLAVSGAALMLIPLVYSTIKRIRPLRRWVTGRVTMATLLRIHIYAGLLGPILVVLHTGHKFGSAIGIALTALTLVAAVSGYAGRFLLSRVNVELADERRVLSGLEAQHQYQIAEVAARPEQRLLAGRVLEVVTSMADVEHAMATHRLLKRIFAGWLRLHIVISTALYALLAAHVLAALHFGIRWLR